MEDTMRVLISDPDITSSDRAKVLFEKHGIKSDITTSGKECQLEIYRGGVDCLILDLDTSNYPGLMVMKYMRLNHPNVRVVMTIKSKNRLKDLGLDSIDLKKLGASTVLVKPISEDLLVKSVKGEQYDAWKQIKINDLPAEDEKVTLAKDEEFTRVKIEYCQSGNVTIFDHYIRLGKGRFVKVLRQGDSFDNARIEKYVNEGKVEFLYFKTKDRTTYINFMNDLLKKMVLNTQGETATIVDTLSSVSDMYLEEVYTSGIKPQLLEEGKKICQNMYQMVKKDSNLARYVREMQETETGNRSHLFLVSFFSTIICKNLDWASERTSETVALGGLLHDIGKLKLPPNLRDLQESAVPENQMSLYREHPLLGIQMLAKSNIVSEPVKQIVYQHHELVNGTGYPNALNSTKIYPPAKIVSLADYFVTLITNEHLSPMEGLRKFIPDKEETAKYDALIIKALVMGLIK